MIRPIQTFNLLSAILFVFAPAVCGGETPAVSLPERPYWTLFAASVERLYAACEIVFESVDRPDLKESMDRRMTGFSNLAGIDRTRPIGLMSTWDHHTTSDIVFVPIGEIPQLLKTATFGVVGYHQVSPDHYEIERPGSPYHVFVRNEYALFGDSLASLKALRVTPDQLTRRLKERYDAAVHVDLLQLPAPLKSAFVISVRSQLEPWLQPQDDEATESANLRKTLGQLVLTMVERVTLDTKSVTAGIRIDPKTRQISAEVVLEAVPKSQMAAALNRMSSHRSEFAPLLQPDIPAGMAFNLPVSGLVERILGTPPDPTAKDSSLEAAIQLAGSGLGDLSLICALRGPSIIGLNEAIPRLILKSEKSGKFVKVNENFEIHKGVVLHSLTPNELPDSVTQWIGKDVEILIGQRQQTIWLGMGNPSSLLDRLLDAIDLVDESDGTKGRNPVVRARFQAQKLPELVASDLLIPNADTDIARQAFAAGKDGFHLTLEPVPDGLKLRVEFEEGFTKLVGQGWIQQLQHPPIE
jgi:hypothetical protein